MNRKSKAIIDAAIAMGYGTAADYTGGSVADVLGQFAAIAQEQGGGGGGCMNVVDAVGGENDTFIVENKTLAQLAELMNTGLLIKVNITESENENSAIIYIYPAMHVNQGGTAMIFAYVLTLFNNNPLWTLYSGADSNGNVVFSRMS